MNSGFSNSREVPRETDIPRAQFETEYFSNQRPAIISGKMNRWRSFNEWSPEWLKKNYGDVEVHASLNIPERSGDFSYWGSDVRWMPLAEFVDHMMKSDQPCYTRQAPSELFPNFDAHFGGRRCSARSVSGRLSSTSA